MERASSCCIFMSAMRWRRAWKVASVTPNCLRVFMYSAVSSMVRSITPTASAQVQAMPMSTACSSAVRPSWVSSVAAASRRLTAARGAVHGGVAARGHALRLALHQEQGDLPLALAGTMSASAWSPAGTTLLSPETFQPLPACVACASHWSRR